MSEKRFEIRTNSNGEHWLFDNKYDKAMMISKIRATLLDVCNMLNEQQATINKVYELLEEADIFSDEATEHDIKAYIELQEFDNKDAYYLACGIKKAIKLLKGDDV